MAWGWRWAMIIAAVGLADVVLRVATGFNMAGLVPAEAVLFFGTSVGLWVLHRRHPAQTRQNPWLQKVLVAAFGLAGMRAALWATGIPVMWANRIVLFVGGALAGLALLRRRRIDAPHT